MECRQCGFALIESGLSGEARCDSCGASGISESSQDRILSSFRAADVSDNAGRHMGISGSCEVDTSTQENRNPYTGELMTGTAAERAVAEIESKTPLKGWLSLGTWKVISVAAVVTGIASWFIISGEFNHNFMMMCLLLVIGFCTPFGAAVYLILSRKLRIDFGDWDSQR